MSTPQTKPNLFIGSSREAIPYARAIHGQLQRAAQVTPWYGGAFSPNDYTMESLEHQLDQNDFGVFVFSPDDVALIRGKYVFVTRDNTLFEMGLFWGKLRRQRVFCIVPGEVKERDDLIEGVKVNQYHLLSDLQGLRLLSYENRTDGNYLAAVDVACGHLMAAIEMHGRYQDASVLLAQKDIELQRQHSVLQFLWEYNKNVTIADAQEKHQALSEAVRNSLLTPENFRITGAAFWKRQGDDGMAQVGGNVGKGKFFRFDKNNDTKIYVVDAYLSGGWTFFTRKQVARVYVLCYPLGTEYVLSVHFSGTRELADEELEEIVRRNDELLGAIHYLVGGDA